MAEAPDHTSARVVIVDNEDSFVYNLAQGFWSLGAGVSVVEAQHTTPGEVLERRPTHLVISPGPCAPAQAGISCALIRQLAGQLPILGVCLGHQAICVAFGGKVGRAGQVMHGKTDRVRHDGRTIFSGLASPMLAARYHSLVIRALPPAFMVSARNDRGMIMAIRHRRWPIEGVQFHPESFLTPTGPALLANFLNLGGEADEPRPTDGRPWRSVAGGAGGDPDPVAR